MTGTSNTVVYLSVCSDNQKELRGELEAVLQRAGLKVIPSDNNSTSREATLIAQADCSVHILHPEYAPTAESDESTSLAKQQLSEAKQLLEVKPGFKIFVWLPPSPPASATNERQASFINEVRSSISKNMIFSTSSSAIQLVDDIRSLMETKEVPVFDISTTEVFLISNQIDEIEAADIIDMLNDIVPVENLNIIQDEDTDYSELCRQQIPQSKLAVVYYKYTSDWALPFTQQVWKKIGGASSPTPILLIGDEDPNADDPKGFKAPKVISMIVAGELIPLEIKVQYDKVTG